MSAPRFGGRACAIGLALFVAAVAPRIAPALAGYHSSNDAAEHLLIARSLARGDGFTLPIRVRDVDGGAAVHEAYGERAPLFPWLLSLVVRAGVGEAGWPDPRLQLVGVALAALCAPVAASVAWELARRRGLGAWSAGWAAVGAGLVVAWAPGLVRASVHLWAEPLGLLLVLLALRLEMGVGGASRRGGRSRLCPYEGEGGERAVVGGGRQGPRSGEENASEGGVGARHAAPPWARSARHAAPLHGPWAFSVVLGLAGGLARFARPEAWVLVPLLIAGAVWRARREPGRWSELAGVVAGLVIVNVIGVSLTGVIAPQLFLFGVTRYEDAMGLGATPVTPGLTEVVGGVLANLAGQAWSLLQPKNAWFVMPVVVIAFARRLRQRPEEGAACRAPTGDGASSVQQGAACRAPTGADASSVQHGAVCRDHAGDEARATTAWLVVWAVAFVLATAGVWSTSDPYRFTITTLALLAPVALVEAVAWARTRWALAMVVGSLVLIMGHAAGRELRGRGPAPAPAVVPQEGVVVTPDPWSYALITGRPAVLGELGR